MLFNDQERPNYLETVLKLIIVIVISGFVFVSPFLLYSNYDELGLVMYLVVLLLLSPSVAFTYKKLIYFRKDELKNAFLSKETYIGIIITLNVVLFFSIGLKTLIPTSMLFILYLLTNLPAYFYFKNQFSFIYTLFSISLVSAMLIINYCFTENTVDELYNYKLNRATSTIYLENNKYEEFIGIRIFWIDNDAEDYNIINYKISEGILGYKVVKNYNFKYQIGD